MLDESAEYTVEEHFANKGAGVRVLYDGLLTLLRGWGPVKEEAKKTSIHLVNRSALAGVYVRRGYINLEFKTDYPIDSPLISKSEQVSRNRYHHTLRLDSPAVLEGEATRWLQDAYRLSG
jgi:hypothetical protein